MRCKALVLIVISVILCPTVTAYDWSANPGNGSPDNPYQISTLEHLMAIGSDEILVTKHYILVSDIIFDPNNPGHVFSGKALIAPDNDLNSSSYEGDSFTGAFDGQMYAIHNLTFDCCGFYGGLFGKVGNGGKVSNLILKNVRIRSANYISSGDRSRYVGSVCGTNEGVVQNCHVTGVLAGGERSNYLGGICGENVHILSHCSVDMEVNLGYLSRWAGGICGVNCGSIVSCNADGEIECANRTAYAGGICGLNNGGSMVDSSASMQIQGIDAIGGLSGGSQSGRIDNCHTQGSVSGDKNVGGMCGETSFGILRNSSSRCTVTGFGRQIGGFCGSTSSVITNCNSHGDVSASLKASYVGGFCGINNQGCIINSFSTGAVCGGGECSSTGGFCGSNGTDATIIKNCYSTGNVSLGQSTRLAGAFCGINSGLLDNCFVQGTFTTNGSFDCGGLCGFNSGAIINSYSAAFIQCENTDNSGGLCGHNDNGVILSSYWDIEASSLATSDGGTGLTTLEMQTGKTYLDAGWDFANEDDNGLSQVWTIKPGDYPRIAFLLPDFTPYSYRGSGTVEEPYLIFDRYEIGAVCQDITACYKLMSDIDLQGINWRSSVISACTNLFDGNGHTVRNFSVQGSSFTGFFGVLREGARIENLTIADASALARERSIYSGILCGYNQSAAISNCDISGTLICGKACKHAGGACGINDSGALDHVRTEVSIVTGGYSWYMGGLCGHNFNGILTECSAKGSLLTADSSVYIGGLCGLSSGRIYGSSADMTIEAGCSCGFIGGLCGEISQAKVDRSFTNGSVYGGESSTYLGGFAGRLSFSSTKIEECFAGTDIHAGNLSINIGGFAGFQNLSAKVLNCYATGSVSGSKNVGGFIGHIVSCTITNCYSVGRVVGSENTGGLIGFNYSSTAEASYWDTESSGIISSSGGEGKTTQEMQEPDSFISGGWDFIQEFQNGVEETWRLCNQQQEYPQLNWRFPLGDFTCPHGVTAEDFQFLASRWLCDGVPGDINGDFQVDMQEIRIMGQFWNAYDTESGGDLTGDGLVGLDDLSIVLDGWLEKEPPYSHLADLNGDKIVGIDDFMILCENWLTMAE